MPADGIRYFLDRACRGWGSVPALPRDVRQIIYEFTYPRVVLRCCRCDHVILVESLRVAWFQIRSYIRLEDRGIVCMSCLMPHEWAASPVRGLGKKNGFQTQ